MIKLSYRNIPVWQYVLRKYVNMTDLRTTYLGIGLKNPFIASASPLTSSIEGIKQIENSGASALVMFSLMEEQFLNEITNKSEGRRFAEQYLDEMPVNFKLNPDEYYELIRKAKQSIEIPVIASLNGTEAGEWLSAAEKIEEAGADALELNIYSPPLFYELGLKEIEDRYIDIVNTAREYTDLPIGVKLTPNHTDFISLAKKLDKAGADGFVLFNRNFQPDIDTNTMEFVAKPYYSGENDSILPMRWTSLLYGRILGEIAASGGILTTDDAIKMFLSGADAVMIFSAILKNGFGVVKTMESELTKWMLAKDFRNIQEFKGMMSAEDIEDPSSYERIQYLRILNNF